MADRCLFSAPFDFLPAATLDAYRAAMPTEFREIWKLEQLKADPDLTVWAPNPGQNFVIDDGVLDLFPALKVVATPSTGTNHVNKAALAARGVSLYCLLDERDVLESIAASPEFTFLLMLNTLRRLDFAIDEVKAGRWREREDMLRGHEMEGKTIGLIGLGRIGRRLKRWCQAFDARVVYHDPYVQDPSIESLPLERLFAECDMVVVCCYLTPETDGMIGWDLLSRLKHGACLVNSARGEVIVESDLVRLIDARPDVEIGLDVVTGEVNDTHLASKLIERHRSGRIVVTPHIAGATIESQSKAALGALASIKRHFRVGL